MHSAGISINLFTLLILVVFLSESVHGSKKALIEPPGDCKGDAWPPVKDIVVDPHAKEALAGARQTVLEAHNQWRQLHGAPPLTMSDDLNEKAQHLAECSIKWETWKRVSDGESYYSGIHPQDRHTTLQKLAVRASDHWYGDYCQGVSNANHREGVTDTYGKIAFYRIVWKSTSTIGIGFARTTSDNDGKFRAVALVRYSTSDYTAEEINDQVKPLGSLLDNVVCCRNKDPDKGQLFKNIGKDHELCVVAKVPDKQPEENDEDNNGGNGCGNGGWWPGFLNFKFPWNSNGAGWWGYSGFHVNEN